MFTRTCCAVAIVSVVNCARLASKNVLTAYMEEVQEEDLEGSFSPNPGRSGWERDVVAHVEPPQIDGCQQVGDFKIPPMKETPEAGELKQWCDSAWPPAAENESIASVSSTSLCSDTAWPTTELIESLRPGVTVFVPIGDQPFRPYKISKVLSGGNNNGGVFLVEDAHDPATAAVLKLPKPGSSFSEQLVFANEVSCTRGVSGLPNAMTFLASSVSFADPDSAGGAECINALLMERIAGGVDWGNLVEDSGDPDTGAIAPAKECALQEAAGHLLCGFSRRGFGDYDWNNLGNWKVQTNPEKFIRIDFGVCSGPVQVKEMRTLASMDSTSDGAIDLVNKVCTQVAGLHGDITTLKGAAMVIAALNNLKSWDWEDLMWAGFPSIYTACKTAKDNGKIPTKTTRSVADLIFHSQHRLQTFLGIRAHTLNDTVSSITGDTHKPAVGELDTKTFTRKAAFFLCSVIIIVLVSYLVYGAEGKMYSLLACGVSLCLAVSIDVSISVQKSKSESYDLNPMCAICLVEFLKLVVSLALHGFNCACSGNQVVPERLSVEDAKWLLLPSVVYTINNYLVWYAIGKNDLATFGIFRDTMVFWTALIWFCTFWVPLGRMRLVGLGLILGGLVASQVAKAAVGLVVSWAACWVLLMTLTNAVSGVLNEKALKRNFGLDLNVQNSIMYSMMTVLSLMLIAVQEPRQLLSARAFLDGFSTNTFITICLQVSSGLLVSRLLKYTDATMKTVAKGLRDPVLVLLTTAPPIVVSSAILSATGCLIYLFQGPLKVPDVTDATENTEGSREKKLREEAAPAAAG